MPKANRRNGDDMIGCDRSSIVVSQPIIADVFSGVTLVYLPCLQNVLIRLPSVRDKVRSNSEVAVRSS